jgi:hypothetical protein
MEKFFCGGDVDFRIFDAHVVAVKGHAGDGQQTQTQQWHALVWMRLDGFSFGREQPGSRGYFKLVRRV